jgi:TPR repeat protein
LLRLVLAGTLVAALAAPALAQAPPPRVALVIGNNAYPDAPLRNPVNDARAMAGALRRAGFDVLVRENLTQKQMLRAMAEFGRKVVPGSSALFYYAGHGLQLGGKNYLVPVDAVIEGEADIRLETVDVDAVLDQVRENSLNLIILDACRNNPFERRSRGSSRGLATIEAPVGTLIAYATAPGKVASDGDGRGGLYAGELVKAMATPGLKVEDVFKRVRAAVARQSRNEQIPWESSSLVGDFYFAPAASAAPAAPSPATPPVTAAIPPPGGQPRPAALRECDELAGVRDPAEAGTRDVWAETIVGKRAVAPCRQAVALMPASPRYMTQYARALAVARDDTEAVIWYRKAAELDYPRGQGGLGTMYENGRGVTRDLAEALRWYRKAADQGDSLAQNNLGWMYADGRGGLRKDEAEAVRLFRLAADRGYARAQNSLGLMYANGRGVRRDDAEAAHWYRKGADQGDPLAQNNLGWRYLEGVGVKKDEAEAMRLFRLAADQGYGRGHNSLGVMYLHGRGIPKDEAEARRSFRKGADRGDPYAQANLAWMHADGKGGMKKDEAEAVRLFRRAADQGNGLGQASLGFMYEKGRGVPKDEAEAIRWYRKGVDQGEVLALNLLGLAYAEGRGVPRDDVEAVRLYRLAADQLSARGQYHLGSMYEQGRGVPQDGEEAVRFYRLAAEQGHDTAKQNLQRLCSSPAKPRNCPE